MTLKTRENIEEGLLYAAVGGIVMLVGAILVLLAQWITLFFLSSSFFDERSKRIFSVKVTCGFEGLETFQFFNASVGS